MSAVWTIGAVTDAPGRAAFSTYIRLLVTGKAVDDHRFKDFKLKAPAYDSNFIGGGKASQAADGDVRDHDYNDMLEAHNPGAGAGEGKEEEESKHDGGGGGGEGHNESRRSSVASTASKRHPKDRRNSIVLDDTPSRFKLDPVTEGEQRTGGVGFPG